MQVILDKFWWKKMLKVFSVVALSILLSTLIVVGLRAAGPAVIIQQTSDSTRVNGDGGMKPNSMANPESLSNQTQKGANDDGNATSGGNVGIMWVAPSRVSFPNDSVTMGYKFNVTVWLNMTQGIFAYQVVLHYDRTQLKCDRVGFTDGRTSVYFEGHYSSEEIGIDKTAWGNGSVAASEGCVGSDYISGPHVASLMWAEFEVVSVPSGNMSFGSKFDISTEYPDFTWVWDPSGDPVQIMLSDGYYEILSTSDLSVSLDPAAVAMQVGQSQLFAANATGGSSPYTFQWYNDYEAALDGIGSNWTFTPSTAGSHLVYVKVTDSSNAVVTSNFVSVDATSSDLYNVTINAICDTEAAEISVPITMDGSSTNLNTPQTFTNLTGSHSFALPSLDSNGHSFRLWDQGSASTTIVLSNGGTYTARYGGNQWPASTMWVEPANVNLTGDSAEVGYRFNVTFWLNMTQNIRAYEIGLHYDRSQLKCDRVGFTDGGTSEYFTGHYSTAEVAFDPGFLGSGSILACECCSGSDYVSGPRVASLMWAEFEVVSVPSGNMSFGSKFDISTEYPAETWVWDRSGDNIQIALRNGNYQILGSDVSAGLTGVVVQSNAVCNSISWNMPCAVPERRRQLLANETRAL